MGKNVVNGEMSDGFPIILYFPARQLLSSLTAPSTHSLQRALLFPAHSSTFPAQSCSSFTGLVLLLPSFKKNINLLFFFPAVAELRAKADKDGMQREEEKIPQRFAVLLGHLGWMRSVSWPLSIQIYLWLLQQQVEISSQVSFSQAD